MTTEARVAAVHRVTSESDVEVKLNLDGTGESVISTGVGFYDHMLTALSRHSLIDMEIKTTGDIYIDGHHSIEDTAIAIGQALKSALGDKRGIRRFADATVPLDEALARCVVDVAGRPYVVVSGEPEGQIYARIGGTEPLYAGSMTQHVIESLAFNAGICVHLTLLAGREPHHIVEAEFKSLARALRFAVEPDPRVTGVPSTKGAL
ncbi:Imidazoleglycerol-phosphate dehydratase [bioreactor metagenome]|jgi:imidazoleglycerol-phosphate dehydratase|uniref:Imidazoleglycerol-phosphate dehydratase n=2 Tax=root TaxID=1 RepID=A0AAN0K9L9_9ACTN|nr:imidazoleglycerol-phosphate dehydratase HisB [Brooklawnia sp. SH051]MCB0884461.1 imidazoleglycerol-phosphate dehydratase HisB [Propionibacteriaceae bacterium]MEA5121414.1 imidazoleglycerol-phosphate dehydratase HisB [Propionibacterium sp.]BEH03561.1 imidazoleglycerol-phosphate dehydratase HisB [Brooklawnia sp. SH051]